MASLNKVLLIGNLGADPELRYTQNQKAVCSFNIATTEYSGGRDGGEKKEHTEWHRCVTWEKTAENCSKFLAKGRAVHVEGRLRTRKWTDKDGVERYTTEIHADNVQFLTPAKDAQGDTQQRPQTGGAQRKPQGGQPSQSQGGFDGQPTPGLEEIPF